MRVPTAALFTVALTAACAGDLAWPTATTSNVASLDSPTAMRRTDSALPFSGSCEARAAGPPTFTPPVLTQLSVGTCQLSHLGRASIRTVQHVNTATGVQIAEITYAAANGDMLFVASVGTSTAAGPSSVTFGGVNTITGGTGRFASATGRFEAAGTANLATGAASFTYEGLISYDASDRGGR